MERIWKQDILAIAKALSAGSRDGGTTEKPGTDAEEVVSVPPEDPGYGPGTGCTDPSCPCFLHSYVPVGKVADHYVPWWELEATFPPSAESVPPPKSGNPAGKKSRRKKK